jgi:peroxiredoxin
MTKKYIASFFLFLIFVLSDAQTVKINGSAKSYQNKEIGVWVYRDYISNLEKQLTFSQIDSLGNFTLEFEIKEIQYVTLKIDKHIASMYVEPNEVYEVMINPPDSNTYHNPNLEQDVKIAIKLESKKEINALTIDYDKRFDNFLTSQYPAFVSRTPKGKIDSFKISMVEFYSKVQNDFFKNYITYSIAALEEKTYSSRKKLYAEYLHNKPILYNHPEYFLFFNTFYKNYLQNYSSSKKELAISYLINKHCSIDGVMNILKKDAFLENDTLRELVLIKGLYESYYDGAFAKDSIVKMLEQLNKMSLLPEHKLITQNILNSFSKLRPGLQAAFFELPDKTGITHSLDELRSKKYVYIVFFQTTCTACLQQMKVISSFKKKYGKQIEFVGICEDAKMKTFKEFCIKNPQYDWQLLFDNTGNSLKTNYELRSYPTYFLINPDGKFVQVPADGPEDYIDRTFSDITKPVTKKTKVGDKKNR